MPTLIDYQNRPVRLTDERLAHILLHPEMVGMETAIIDTCKTPVVHESQQRGCHGVSRLSAMVE